MGSATAFDAATGSRLHCTASDFDTAAELHCCPYIDTRVINTDALANSSAKPTDGQPFLPLSLYLASVHTLGHFILNRHVHPLDLYLVDPYVLSMNS